MRQRATSLLLPVFLMLFLIALSFSPWLSRSPLHTQGGVHYGAHLLAFGLLAFLAGRGAYSPRAKLFLLLCIVLLGAGIEEAEHLIFAGEILEVGDILTDALGALVGFVIAVSTLRRSR